MAASIYEDAGTTWGALTPREGVRAAPGPRAGGGAPHVCPCPRTPLCDPHLEELKKAEFPCAVKSEQRGDVVRLPEGTVWPANQDVRRIVDTLFPI